MPLPLPSSCFKEQDASPLLLCWWSGTDLDGDDDTSSGRAPQRCLNGQLILPRTRLGSQCKEQGKRRLNKHLALGKCCLDQRSAEVTAFLAAIAFRRTELHSREVVSPP